MTTPPVTAAAPRRYVGEWGRFVDWCAGTDRAALPASQADVLAYLDDERPTAGTVGRWLAAITAAHRAAGAPNPCVGLVTTWVRHTRTTGTLPDTTGLLSGLADTVRRLPLTGWPGGMFARRDRLAYLLHRLGGIPAEQLTRLRVDEITMLGPRRVAVCVGGCPVAVLQPIDDAAVCVACALTEWMRVVQHIDNSASTDLARALANPATAVPAAEMHVCERVTPAKVHGPAGWPLLPAINRWGHTAVPPPPPISDRGLTTVLRSIAQRAWQHAPVPINPAPASASIPAPVPVSRTRLADLAGPGGGAAARTRARQDLEDLGADWDAIDTAADQLNQRINHLVEQAAHTAPSPPAPSGR